MLLATNDSAVAKNPRLRFNMVRSASVSDVDASELLLFHMAMSACIDTSVGIQWLLQPARYFSQAQWYFSGSSWLTSALALIIAFSPTDTRPPSRSIEPRPVVP